MIPARILTLSCAISYGAAHLITAWLFFTPWLLYAARYFDKVAGVVKIAKTAIDGWVLVALHLGLSSVVRADRAIPTNVVHRSCLLLDYFYN